MSAEYSAVRHAGLSVDDGKNRMKQDSKKHLTFFLHNKYLKQMKCMLIVMLKHIPDDLSFA